MTPKTLKRLGSAFLSCSEPNHLFWYSVEPELPETGTVSLPHGAGVSEWALFPSGRRYTRNVPGANTTSACYLLLHSVDTAIVDSTLYAV
jgi:hypothetical protein